MEVRYFYFTVHSARNLIDVRPFGELKAYAKVSIAGKSKCTEVDLVNEMNPEWNTKLCFFVPEKDIEEGKVDAVIELFCKSLSDDKYIGELNLVLAPFYKGECDYEVCRNDSNQSKSFGTLKFSHELGDKVIVVSESLPPSSKDYSEMVNIANFGLEARYFYFTVHSARNLIDVRPFGEMKVYAKVSIAGKSKCTEVDLVNETNPEWNTKLCFFVPEKDIEEGRVDAVIELFCKSLSDDKYIGELNLILAPFYKGECDFEVCRNDSNQSKSFGTLKFSHELGDKVIVVSESLPPSSKDYSEMVNIANFGLEARYFYFTVHSARNLIDVRPFGEMKVYAKVSIAGKSKCTEVDLVNETNPEWNTKLCFFVPEKDIEEGKVDAVIELFCQRSFLDDKYVGELNLTVAPFYKGECEFQVCRNDSKQSKSFGTLKFSHELGDKVIVV